MSGQTPVTVYSSSNYKYGVKPPKAEKDRSVDARFQRMQQK